MQLVQYLHTALLVSQLEPADHFYGTILGLPRVDRPFNFPGSWYQVGNVQIHLIEDPALVNVEASEKWGRNRHLAFAVKDLQLAYTELLSHGCDVQKSASGRAALFTRDPDGNIIELSQMELSQMELSQMSV